MMEISHPALFGNVQVTAQAVQELCDRDIPICYFSYGGWFRGITSGLGHKNVELRCRQYLASDGSGNGPVHLPPDGVRQDKELPHRAAPQSPEAAATPS